jgi:hypothetical protein
MATTREIALYHKKPGHSFVTIGAGRALRAAEPLAPESDDRIMLLVKEGG